MNNQPKNKEDLLNKYINPEKIEKAPEGFTTKVMTRIQLETADVKVAGRVRYRNFIPAISAFVTISLVLAAILIPGSQTDPLSQPVLEFFKRIKFSLPEVDFTSIFNSDVPVLLIYVIIGLSVLTLFDRVLSVLFHREK
jgi:hypothetical protein